MSKMTKALYPKRPTLIPLLDSVVQAYLRDDDPGAQVPVADRALGLVRGCQHDLHRNQAAVQAIRQDLTGRLRAHRGADLRPADLVRPGHGLTGSSRRPGATAPPPLAPGRAVSGSHTINNFSMQHRPPLPMSEHSLPPGHALGISLMICLIDKAAPSYADKFFLADRPTVFPQCRNGQTPFDSSHLTNSSFETSRPTPPTPFKNVSKRCLAFDLTAPRTSGLCNS
jgi:hypothetical protein